MKAIQQLNLPAGLTGECVASLDDSLRDEFLQKAFAKTGEEEILKPGSRSTVSLIKLGKSSYVLKQYKRLSIRRRMRYALTRSRSRQSWEGGLAMLEAGIPLASPLAWIEESCWGIPGRSAILLEFVEGESLDTIAASLSEEELIGIAAKLRDIFSRMKVSRITHGDMKASNILVTAEREIHLIDLDGVIVHRSESAFTKQRGKDYARFMKNWQTQPEVAQVFADVFDKT